MAAHSDVLAALGRQGTAAGQAVAEQDYHSPAAHRPEREESFDALYDDAWAAAWEATSEAVQPSGAHPGEQSDGQSGEPYGDDFEEAEAVFVHAFIDAYRARWSGLARDATG